MNSKRSYHFNEVIALGPAPKNLGGYQNIVHDEVRFEDLIVTDNGDNKLLHWAFDTIGFLIVDGVIQDPFIGPRTGRVYRKLAVPRQGGAAFPEAEPGLHVSSMDRAAPVEVLDRHPLRFTAPLSFISQDSAVRKGAPMFRGLLGYFPAALFAVAQHSQESDLKHNPGNVDGPHWARHKSSDHADCIVRHLIDAGVPGTPGREIELRAIAWRALALLQEELESQGYAPGVSSRFSKEAA